MMWSVEQQRQVPTVGLTHGRGVTETVRCQSVTTDASDGMAEGPSPSMDPVQRVVGVTTQRTTASVGANVPTRATATMTETSIASMARLGPRELGLSQAVKLLPGERMGWWSSQKYDKRKRMRALVQGAVDDTRTRILLDTGANVSVVSAALAKRLRLRDIPDHGRSLEVKGINPGVMATTRRALVKITLGWERVYEFEVWIMDHNAGVDVVLGTDFMIPAGVRLDLFHGTARLPDKVLWLATQPPDVERPAYVTPRKILRRPSEASLEGDIQEWACAASDGSSSSDTASEVSVDSPRDSGDGIQPTGATTEAADIQPSELDPTEDYPSTAESNTVETLYSNYVCALVGGEPDTVDADTTATAEHTVTVGGLDDYTHKLAFLPDLSEGSVTDLNYTGDNVLNQDLSQDMSSSVSLTCSKPTIPS
ncbi:unnamed protein product [Phytophthora lilii]|uniref:Unnamed protein product n=1 Tax=Phytophthora lilii TaxID=2077276 RepID=A0A9W7CPF5_9STRA|nr:unnamed protein product [Phytophthora lilii]